MHWAGPDYCRREPSGSDGQRHGAILHRRDRYCINEADPFCTVH